MQLRFRTYDLQLKHTFTVSGFSRATSPVVLTEIEYDGIIGYGEASMPPYLGESHESVVSFLKKIDLSLFKNPLQIDEILDYVAKISKYDRAAKASIDIALHDLFGKIRNQPLHQYWGLDANKTPYTSYTIGIDTPEIVKEKTKEAYKYKIIKVKLGGGNDKEMIRTIRELTDVQISIDANQGWTDKFEALDMIHWLKEQDIIFIEQPMPTEQIDDMAWLTQNSPLPTIADESFQRLDDVSRLKDVFSGINIKLMKSTGLREAKQMVSAARRQKMKVMIGCMTETSCAVSAAAQLSPLVDWADLDGNLLITNDIFEGVKINDGKITLNDQPGIGVKKI